MLLVANACWGLSFPLMKAAALVQMQVTPDSSSWFTTATMLAPRFVLAAVVLAVAFGRTLADVTPNEWRQGLGLGAFASVGMLFQSDGIQFTDASTSAFLTQLYAILIPITLALWSRRNPGARVWLCAVLVLAGVAILGRFDWRTLELGRGEAETLLASVFFMGQILWLERPGFAGNRPLRITLVMFLFEGLVFLVMGAVTAPSSAAVLDLLIEPSWWGFTLGLTLFSTLGAYILMNKWQPRITATEAGLIYCVEPIFGSLFALFLPGLFSVWAAISYPNETATTHLLVGGGLITLANVILQLRRPPPSARLMAPSPAATSRVA